MTKEQVQMKGFEIVAYAGDARSRLIEALEILTDERDYDRVEEIIKESTDLIIQANSSQLDLLRLEAEGGDNPYSFTMMHGQDHLMTTVLLKDLMSVLVRMQKQIEGLEEKING